MALDVITEFVFRTLGQFVLEVVFVCIFYWPGWLILRVLTVGRYPPKQSEPHSRGFVAMVAFMALLACLTLVYSGVLG